MKNLTFTFSEREANLILKGLQELPFKESNDLINNIVLQAKSQKEDKKTEEKE